MPGTARGGPRLRTTLAVVTGGITVFALALCAVLAVLTTHLHRTSDRLADTVESVRLAEEIEIDLLLHARARDPRVRRTLRRDIMQRLAEARAYSSSSDELGLVEAAHRRLSAYLSARDGVAAEERQHAALTALEALVALNVADSRAAREHAAYWNRLANALALGMAGSLLLTAGWLLWWLWRRAFEPVLALAGVMERFGRGDHEARAREFGPAELRDMAEGFNAMANDLRAQRRSQMSFLAGVAHDLRTPLSVLSTSAGMIPSQGPLPPEPVLRRTIDLVKRQLGLLDRMIADLLDVASIEAGRLQLRLGQHDVRTLVDAVVDLYRAAHPDRAIDVAQSDLPLVVSCDALRLEQVVGNLVSNALKYSPPDCRVEVALHTDGEEAVIDVTDHGDGIAEPDRRRLFEPFHRARHARDTTPGSGLGLFVVRRIVESHGGCVDVDSAPGDGARFRIRLPLVRRSAHVADESPERPCDARQLH